LRRDLSEDYNSSYIEVSSNVGFNSVYFESGSNVSCDGLFRMIDVRAYEHDFVFQMEENEGVYESVFEIKGVVRRVATVSAVLEPKIGEMMFVQRV
jgi:hypothetical protein